MNFNHLFEERELRLANNNGKCASCHWLPASEGQASAANNMAVQMYCKNCNSRTTIFMHIDDYKIHDKVITQEVNRVKAS